MIIDASIPPEDQQQYMRNIVAQSIDLRKFKRKVAWPIVDEKETLFR